MVKIIVEEDCGNAPKKEYVRDFNIAFAQNDVDKVLSMMTDDATWRMVGGETYQGGVAIRQALQKMGEAEAQELRLDHILSHGNQCAADGLITYKNSKVAFCDVYVFSSHAKDAKIKELISYAIEVG